MDALERPGDDLVRDEVHDATDGARSVEQRRRPAYDLDLRGGGGVERHAVVGGLAREVAGAGAVLQDQHAVVVEAAHDRPRVAGAEAAHVDPRLAGQRRAQRVAQALLEVLAPQHGGRLIRLERVARVRADGHRLGEVHLGRRG